ncbi:MAG: hypothetical protein LBQ81_07980 [Zoogloeaceae bacterium]|jgi:hypothetical protein|nr:hypothetical protein [Zoogloeaceae bacterium]
MSERIIHTADLSAISSGLADLHDNLRALQSNIEAVSENVNIVEQNVNNTRADLARLEGAFLSFVEADTKAKALALAESRVIKIRQELETSFGYYAEVRRHATGILQAADVSIVRQETLKTATENLMLSAPRYWLAPALVALAAWLCDNKALAEKALAEAIRRDDEKTSLFFALITRRTHREDACRIWLDRYFGMQDPLRLDRQSVVLVDALASGIFGAQIRAVCSKRIESWVEELSQRPGFLEEQRTQWNEGLRSKTPTINHAGRYAHLSKYSPGWSQLNDALNGATMQMVVLAHFQDVFEGEIPPSPNLMAAVDGLLDKLVANFDDEELPLRRQETLNQLIIDEDGDKTAAQNRYALESKALDEIQSFTQLLTNAAMHPEKASASRATQRFSIALSKKWIKDAHQDLSASIRAAVPNQIDLDIADWQGKTRNGDNEQTLSISLAADIDHRRDEALGKAKLTWKNWLGLVIGAGSAGYGLINGSYLLDGIGAIFLIFFFLAWRNNQAAKKEISTRYGKLKEQSLQILQATLAEMVEWRRDFARRDAVSAEVSQFLDGITPAQYLLSTHDSVRHVNAKFGA